MPLPATRLDTECEPADIKCFDGKIQIFVVCIIPIRFSNNVSNVHTHTHARIHVNDEMHFLIEFSELHFARSANFCAYRIFCVNEWMKKKFRTETTIRWKCTSQKQKKHSK